MMPQDYNTITEEKKLSSAENARIAALSRKDLTSLGYVPGLGVYEDLLANVYKDGNPKIDRTGTGTLSIFAYQMRFNLKSIPMVTTKKLFLKGVIHELLWILSGSTNIQYLNENGVGIWDEWADANGDLGPVYGEQWRSWKASDGRIIDQIKNLIEGIKRNPDSRRHMVSAWNPAEIDQMKLPPCHALFQFYVANGKLSCQLYQRSADLFLGVPFNICSYALLTYMVAQQCDLGVGEFIWTGGDCHIYVNHMEQVELQLSRKPRPYPELIIKRRPQSLFDYKFEDFEIVGYDPHPAIGGKVAV